MIVTYKEIFKLKVMLDKENIPYEFYDRSFFNADPKIEYPSYQIIIYKPNQEEAESPERLISVVQGMATYGATEDLLEIMGCLTNSEKKYDSVLGYLSAKEVFKRIKKNYSKCLGSEKE